MRWMTDGESAVVARLTFALRMMTSGTPCTRNIIIVLIITFTVIITIPIIISRGTSVPEPFMTFVVVLEALQRAPVFIANRFQGSEPLKSNRLEASKRTVFPWNLDLFSTCKSWRAKVILRPSLDKSCRSSQHFVFLYFWYCCATYFRSCYS